MIIRYEITPLLGVGPILLGMTQNEVHAALGEPGFSYRKTLSSEHVTDCYHQNACQIFYTGSSPCVEYIELSRSNEFSVFLMSKDVFTSDANELVRYISEVAKFDTEDLELGYSYIFRSIALSIWRPDIQNSNFSTVGIGIRGYYN